jgi:hypothetical protein
MGAYRLFANPGVEPARIIAAQAARTAARCRNATRVLVVQDTTSLDYSRHPRTTGLGVLDNGHAQGLLVHSSLVINEAGTPLGVVAQEVWARENHPERPEDWRYRVPLEAKESRKWLTGLRQSHERLGPDVAVVTVADREADVFELFALASALHRDWIVRARHDRVVAEEPGRLVAGVEATEVGAEATVTVSCPKGQHTRTAHTQVRWAPVTLPPPAEKAKQAIAEWWEAHPEVARIVPTPLDPVAVSVVLVSEGDPPAGVEPVHWLLVTSLPVTTAAEALECVTYYQWRWLIERFHFVLKSGCRIERLQLADATALTRALAILSGVAWHLLALTFRAREEPTAPCTTVVPPAMWQALWATQSPGRPVPPEPPDVQTFVRAVARLGGFLGRRHDGEPGVTTLWRGLMRLHDLTTAYAAGLAAVLSHSTSSPCV